MEKAASITRGSAHSGSGSEGLESTQVVSVPVKPYFRVGLTIPLDLGLRL